MLAACSCDRLRTFEVTDDAKAELRAQVERPMFSSARGLVKAGGGENQSNNPGRGQKSEDLQHKSEKCCGGVHCRQRNSRGRRQQRRSYGCGVSEPLGKTTNWK